MKELRIEQRWVILALILAWAFVVRLWAMHWPPFPIDMNDWIGWGERMREVGPRRFYSPDVFADYAPGYLYVFWLTAAIKHALLPTAAPGLVYFLYRLPPVLCDLAITALIFVLVDRVRRSTTEPDTADGVQPEPSPVIPALAAACFAFNPAVIFNSAVWGQIDATFTLLMLVALVLLLRDRPELAAVSYAVAFLVKPQAISLAPVVVGLLLLRYPPRRVLTAAASGAAVALVLTAPFFGLNVVSGLLGQLRKATATYPYTSLNAYNLWGIYGFWKDDAARSGLGLTLRAIGFLLYGLGLAYGVAMLIQQFRRRADSLLTVFLFAVYFAFLPTMVLTRMHERYVYPVFPFLLVFAVLCLDPRARTADGPSTRRFVAVPILMYVILTVLHTMNLYQVYQYYLNFETGVPATNRLYYAIANNAPVWSVLTLLTFTTFVVCIPYWLPSATTADARSDADVAPSGDAARPHPYAGET